MNSVFCSTVKSLRCVWNWTQLILTLTVDSRSGVSISQDNHLLLRSARDSNISVSVCNMKMPDGASSMLRFVRTKSSGTIECLYSHRCSRIVRGPHPGRGRFEAWLMGHVVRRNRKLLRRTVQHFQTEIENYLHTRQNWESYRTGIYTRRKKATLFKKKQDALFWKVSGTT